MKLKTAFALIVSLALAPALFAQADRESLPNRLKALETGNLTLKPGTTTVTGSTGPCEMTTTAAGLLRCGDTFDAVRRDPVMASQDFFTTTTQASSALGSGTLANTYEANHPGIVSATSSASANSGVVYFLDTFTSSIFVGGERYEATVRFGRFTNVVHQYGLIDANSAAAQTDGCWFEIAAGVMSGVCSNNSVTTSTATTYTASLTTWYRLVIQANADATSIRFTAYDSTGATLWTDTVAAHIPTAAGREFGAGGLTYYTTASDAGKLLVGVDHMSFGYVGLTR